MQNDVAIDRDRFLGGSDIPAVMGISPYKTRFDLLLEKAGLKQNDFTGNEYTEYGNVMEEKIRDYINHLDPWAEDFTEGRLVIEGDPIGTRCHTDGETSDTILEIKTTSHINGDVKEYTTYLVQLLFYMMMCEKPNGILAVYERPEDFSEEFDNSRLYIYPIKEKDFKDTCQKIIVEVLRFKDDLKKVKKNPFITEAELLPNEVVETSKKIVLLENRLAEIKQVEAEIKALKDNLKHLMEQNNVKTWQTPNGYRITLVEDTEDKEVTETYFDEESFKAEHEKMYNRYYKERTVTKKGKSGYVKITPPKK